MAHDPIDGATAPEAFGEAVKGGLSTVNSLVLLACTLSSAAISLYADVAATIAPVAIGYVALAGWLATLTLALYLAGRSTGVQGVWPGIERGMKMARARPGFAALVLVISAGAVFTAWSRATAESGGVLARWLPQLQAMREDTSVIRQAVTREIPPAEQLSRLGFTTAQEDICRAVTEGRVEVWRLMQSVGMPGAPLAVPLGGGQYGTCVEEALLARTPRHGRWAELLTSLPNPNRALDRLYLSRAIGVGHEEPLDATELARSAGARRPQGVSYVFAPLLMYAVWGGDVEAVSALLAAGADPDTGARIELMAPGMPSRYAVIVTPLSEAQRLHQREIVAALRGAGAHSSVSATRSMFDVKTAPHANAQSPSSQPW